MQPERPKQRRWNGVDDPVNHCLAGNSLLLTGLPAPERRTWPGRFWRGCKSRARRCTWCPRRTAPRRTWGWGRRRRGGSAQKLDWLVVEEITQLDMALWADLACVGLNADVKFLLLGDFRQLLGWAAHQRAVGAQPADPRPGRRAQARAHGEHALRPRHLQLRAVAAGRRGGVPHAGAGQGEASPGGRTSATASAWPNAAANRALAPEASKLPELETQVIHIDLGETQNGCDKCITQNSPQSMRVWPGLCLIGAGGKIPKGVFVAVAEVEPDGVRLDNGTRLKNQELLRATRPSHAVTYASCQGLTLHNRVRLDLECCHLTLRHLYVGASQTTSSELLEA